MPKSSSQVEIASGLGLGVAWSAAVLTKRAPPQRFAARTLAPSHIRDLLHRRLQPFRHLHDCSGCFRLERSPGGTCTHWKAPPSHGARKYRTFPEDLPNRSKRSRSGSSRLTKGLLLFARSLRSACDGFTPG